jgi:nitric oxide reductase large subunit
MFKFNVKYFGLTIVLFIIEVLIGVYMHDAIIRPYGGDVLIGILIYCFVKSFINTPVWPTSIAVLLFCYLVETLPFG